MRQGLGAVWIPVLILAAFVVLVYLGMWHGWRKRGRKHDLPPLEPVPDAVGAAELEATGRYFGTTVTGDWLDRVVAHGLGTRSGCRVSLSPEGLDVHRPADSFRIPATALAGARLARGLAGKVVPPRGLLVVTWRHGDHLLDSGFRLTEERHEAWVHGIEEMVKENAT